MLRASQKILQRSALLRSSSCFLKQSQSQPPLQARTRIVCSSKQSQLLLQSQSHLQIHALIRTATTNSSTSSGTTRTCSSNPNVHHQHQRQQRLQSSDFRHQQMRSYVFFPSTLKEAQHDLRLFFDKRRKKRIILVKLMKDRYAKFKSISGASTGMPTRVKRRTRTMRQRLRPPSRGAMAIKYGRWRNRLRNALVRRKIITLQEYSQEHWFDQEGYPLTSTDEAGRFVNPWSSESTNGAHPIWTFLKWRVRRLFTFPFLDPTPLTTLHSVPVNLTPEDPNAIRLTWIGHATCVVQLNGYTVITDPHFSNRAAPVQTALPFNGVARHVEAACDIDDLPQIDVCLLTHDHYDHLDLNTCIALKEKVDRWIVPLGIKDWLIEKCNINDQRIEELQWWQHTQVKNNANDKKNPLQITCAPTQHWASRTMWDRNQRLWCSFVVEAEDKRVFFGGDTGFPTVFPLFKQIGQRLGPFDLAALPIGAYSPRYFMSESHCDPAESVMIHEQIRSKKSVAIHWGTFRLAEEGDDEPRQLLEEAVEKLDTDFSTLQLGESIEVKGSRK